MTFSPLLIAIVCVSTHCCSCRLLPSTPATLSTSYSWQGQSQSCKQQQPQPQADR